MADLTKLNAQIMDAIAAANGNTRAIEGIVAVLITGAGIGIGYATQGRPEDTGVLCDLCGVELAQQTATAVQWVGSLGEMEARRG